MDIYARPGSKVRYLNQNGGDLERQSANHVLREGQIYTVERTDVRDWFTWVYLAEVPSDCFNSVMFEDADTEDSRMAERPTKLHVEEDTLLVNGVGVVVAQAMNKIRNPDGAKEWAKTIGDAVNAYDDLRAENTRLQAEVDFLKGLCGDLAELMDSTIKTLHGRADTLESTARLVRRKVLGEDKPNG